MVKFHLLAFLFTCAMLTSQLVAAQESKPDTTKASAASERVFEVVEVEASVNALAWRTHLESALIKPLIKAAKKGMKAGIYTVNVRFLVERDGSISSATALNDPGYGLAEASEKVIKTGPRWNPGEQKGRKVRSYHTQPITFQIAEE